MTSLLALSMVHSLPQAGALRQATADALAVFAIPRAVELRAMAADASLLLLVGGLAMLSVIMVLVAIQNVVPERMPSPAAVGGESGLSRMWPKRPKKIASGLPVDKAMARIVHLKLGEPRILQARSRTTRVRLYGCPGCSFELAEATPVNATCNRERGGVEQAFKDVYGGRVSAWEIACRRRGDDACDFEVKH